MKRKVLFGIVVLIYTLFFLTSVMYVPQKFFHRDYLNMAISRWDQECFLELVGEFGTEFTKEDVPLLEQMSEKQEAIQRNPSASEEEKSRAEGYLSVYEVLMICLEDSGGAAVSLLPDWVSGFFEKDIVLLGIWFVSVFAMYLLYTRGGFFELRLRNYILSGFVAAVLSVIVYIVLFLAIGYGSFWMCRYQWTGVLPETGMAFCLVMLIAFAILVVIELAVMLATRGIYRIIHKRGGI